MEQLLKILEDNARLPIEDIATMLNKSPAEVAAMIDLARAQGIIKGYKTLVDWEKAGVNRVEAVIELNVSPKKSRGFDEIAATIASPCSGRSCGRIFIVSLYSILDRKTI